jgi:hypothetical protein
VVLYIREDKRPGHKGKRRTQRGRKKADYRLWRKGEGGFLAAYLSIEK